MLANENPESSEQRSRAFLWPRANGTVGLRLAVYPVIAHTQPLDVAGLAALAGERAKTDYDRFPVGVLRTVSRGLVSRDPPIATYLDVSGLTAHQWSEQPNTHHTGAGGSHPIVHPWWVPRAQVLFRWAGRAAREAGRGGTLACSLELSGVAGAALMLSTAMTDNLAQHRSLEQEVRAETSVPTDELLADPLGVTSVLTSQLAYAFDRTIPADAVRELIAGETRPFQDALG